MPMSRFPMSDAKILDESGKTLEEEGVDMLDAFVVEFKQSDGWIAETPRSLHPAPVFNSDDGFFNKMSSTLSPVSSVTAYRGGYFNGSAHVAKPSVSNKAFGKTLQPGTLGLGNMSVISSFRRVQGLIVV